MRGDDVHFMCDAEFVQRFACVLHGLPIGLGSHNDAHLCSHGGNLVLTRREVTREAAL